MQMGGFRGVGPWALPGGLGSVGVQATTHASKHACVRALLLRRRRAGMHASGAAPQGVLAAALVRDDDPAFSRACMLASKSGRCNSLSVSARLITVAAAKGGVGKTTLAYELAAALEAVLVDLDWDTGGATRMWGYDVSRYRRSPILDAFERGPEGRAPRPKTRRWQPSLVPAHPDLAATRIDHDLVTECLLSWAQQWGGDYVVIDTHPGANPLTDGAMAAADLVICPAVLGVREMDALEGMLRDFASYPVAVVPTMVASVPPRRFVERLASLTEGGVPVTPPISEHRWLRRRLRRAALTLQPNPGRQVQRAADEYWQVTKAIRDIAG